MSATSDTSAISATSATTAAPVVRHDHPTPVLGALGLFTVLLGAALPLIDFFIVNVALPTIDHDLDAGPALLELVVAGYGLAYAVLLVLGGNRLGDMVEAGAGSSCWASRPSGSPRWPAASPRTPGRWSAHGSPRAPRRR